MANHFIELRQIPSSNVFYIDWTGGFEITEGETLRDKILSPVLDAIDRRGLLSQIDYIIYSSDFPYAADLSKDLAGPSLSTKPRRSARSIQPLIYGTWCLRVPRS